jgi:hypothetical protein
VSPFAYLKEAAEGDGRLASVIEAPGWREFNFQVQTAQIAVSARALCAGASGKGKRLGRGCTHCPCHFLTEAAQSGLAGVMTDF